MPFPCTDNAESTIFPFAQAKITHIIQKIFIAHRECREYRDKNRVIRKCNDLLVTHISLKNSVVKLNLLC